MILLVHMLFGAAIGSVVRNVPLAIALALLGHYFLDIFPHIEYLDSVEHSIKKIKTGRFKNYLPDMSKVALDFLLGILVILIFSKNYLIIYVCALIAAIPDGLTVVSRLFPNKILAEHDKIHNQKIHYLTKKKKFSLLWRISTQFLAIIISIILLLA